MSVAQLARPPVSGQAVQILVTPESDLHVSPEGFRELCRSNPDLRLERTATGKLIAMSPAGSDSGQKNARITARLFLWNEASDLGVVFDSSAGFTLPNGAIRAPDASWIAHGRYEALTPEQRRGFAPICPDFVIELRSPSDTPAEVRAKMREYLEQGARLGWLIDPIAGAAEVYRPGRDPEVLGRPATLSGEDVLPGFTLDLAGIMS